MVVVDSCWWLVLLTLRTQETLSGRSAPNTPSECVDSVDLVLWWRPRLALPGLVSAGAGTSGVGAVSDLPVVGSGVGARHPHIGPVGVGANLFRHLVPKTTDKNYSIYQPIYHF